MPLKQNQTQNKHKLCEVRTTVYKAKYGTRTADPTYNSSNSVLQLHYHLIR